MRRRGGIKTLGSGLSKLVGSLGGREHADTAAVASVWEHSVGQDVARHTFVRGVRRGELLVAVDSPVWATQLQAMSEELRGRINEEMGKELVRTTRFTVSRKVAEERAQADREERAARRYGGERVAPAPLDESEMGEARTLVADIDDPDIRAAALRAIVAEKEWEKGALARQENRRSDTTRTGPENGA